MDSHTVLCLHTFHELQNRLATTNLIERGLKVCQEVGFKDNASCCWFLILNLKICIEVMLDVSKRARKKRKLACKRFLWNEAFVFVWRLVNNGLLWASVKDCGFILCSLNTGIEPQGKFAARMTWVFMKNLFVLLCLSAKRKIIHQRAWENRVGVVVIDLLKFLKKVNKKVRHCQPWTKESQCQNSWTGACASWWQTRVNAFLSLQNFRRSISILLQGQRSSESPRFKLIYNHVISTVPDKCSRKNSE